MQCVIDGRRLSPSPAIKQERLLKFIIANALRFGFDDFLVLGRDNFKKYFPENHPDLKIPPVFTQLDPGPELAPGQLLEKCGAKLDSSFLFIDSRAVHDFNWLELYRLSRTTGMCHIPIYGGRVSQTMGWLIRDAVMKLAGKKQDCAGLFADLLEKGLARKVEAPGPIIGISGNSALALPERGAVFLDRDGVLNRDFGYVHSLEQWEWLPGARESIKAMNNANLYVFVVTNQAGIARGYYGEDAVRSLHKAIQADLKQIGAHIDAFRYCPYHPDGVVEAYRTPSSWRKPAPGMIEDLFGHWPIKREKSFLVGDKQSDLEAARAAGLPASLFQAEKLDLAQCRANLGL